MRIVVTEFLSLDGVMEAPHEWHFPFFSEDAASYKLEELRRTDALLLGRVTYEGFAAAWPERSGDEFSDTFNSMPKYVVSTTLENPTWNNSHVLRGNVMEELGKLKAQPGQDLVIHGSADLVNSLMPPGLIDEYRLMVHPIVVGHGKRLFRDGTETTPLRLVDTTVFSGGALVLTLAPAEPAEGVAA